MRKSQSKYDSIRLFTPIIALVVSVSSVRAEHFITPDTPSVLGGTIWEAHEIVRNDAGTFSLERALPAGTPLDATHRMDSGDWLLSVSEPTALGGLFYDPRDVVRYDGATFSVFFNGATAGIPAVANVDAVFLLGGDSGDVVLSLDIPVSIAGVIYEPADLLRFNGSALSLFFDASAASPPIPSSTNVIEADERAGRLYLSFDVPTGLGTTTFLPGQVVSWNGSSFAVRFGTPGWPAGSAMTGLALGDCLDADGDRFGEPGDIRCSGGAGDDCNDYVASVQPGGTQLCGDGLNNDCSSPTWPALAATNEADDDVDGYTECGGDCADSSPSVFPAAAQLCGDGLNNDCSSPSWPALAGTNEADDDGDLLSECTGDCNDADAGALAPPIVVDGLEVTAIVGGYRYSWDDQSASAGAGTVYDVFWGSVGMLGSSGDYSTGICGAENAAGSDFDELGVSPAAGEAFYFMFRAQNSCGTATWGTMNRDTTAAASFSACL